MVCGARPLTRSALDTLLGVVCGEDDANAAQGERRGETTMPDESLSILENEQEELSEKRKHVAGTAYPKPPFLWIQVQEEKSLWGSLPFFFFRRPRPRRKSPTPPLVVLSVGIF